eukprot:TRINITY_DN9561_c0_g1_i2.p1 TRINITY_DN9561_c0_g1~~TRINITY_DN9561_c0_g1_i2.p1  ORF type:complete len:192 (-),score=32.44 TRINITY_DN9561_c0_g1_i2:795-1370(-)
MQHPSEPTFAPVSQSLESLLKMRLQTILDPDPIPASLTKTTTMPQRSQSPPAPVMMQHQFNLREEKRTFAAPPAAATMMHHPVPISHFNFNNVDIMNNNALPLLSSAVAQAIPHSLDHPYHSHPHQHHHHAYSVAAPAPTPAPASMAPRPSSPCAMTVSPPVQRRLVEGRKRSLDDILYILRKEVRHRHYL